MRDLTPLDLTPFVLSLSIPGGAGRIPESGPGDAQARKWYVHKKQMQIRLHARTMGCCEKCCDEQCCGRCQVPSWRWIGRSSFGLYWRTLKKARYNELVKRARYNEDQLFEGVITSFTRRTYNARYNEV